MMYWLSKRYSLLNLLCSDTMSNTYWQPISTIPERKLLDIWIKSKDSETYGRRLTNVVYVDGKFCGSAPEEKYGEYASHWCLVPDPPED